MLHGNFLYLAGVFTKIALIFYGRLLDLILSSMYSIDNKIINRKTNPIAIGRLVYEQDNYSFCLVNQSKAFEAFTASLGLFDFDAFVDFFSKSFADEPSNTFWLLTDSSNPVQFTFEHQIYNQLYINYIDDTDFIIRFEAQANELAINGTDKLEVLPNPIDFTKQDVLNESQRMLYTLFSNLPGMAYRCKNDKDWTMEMVSDGCYQLTGYQPNELLNNAHIAFNDIIRPDFQTHLWTKWQTVLAQHEYFEEEYPIVLPDGSEKWVFERGCGVFDANGVLIALEGYITDIDRLKKASLQVTKSYEYFVTIFNSINDAVFIHDFPNGAIQDINQKACELFGYSHDELLQMDLGQLSSGKNDYTHEKALGLLERAVNEGPQVVEWYARNSQNQDFWVEANVCFANFGSTQKIVITIRDIQERKHAQDVLRKSEEDLKELNALKDKFFSIIAHDLKSPFNAILGFSELLTSDYDSYSEADRKRQVQNVYEAANTAYKLVQNLLDWARLQIGRFETRMVNVELSSVINEIIGLCRSIAAEKNIHVVSEVNYGTFVMADQHMLSSVLRNLLINAIKFSFRGGEIRLNVNTFAQPGFLEVNIIDSGVGIQPDDMAKLFKLEYKVKQQGTAKEIGTGLGLIISSDLIKAMGGKIGVESQLGVGSRFWFLLAQP